MKKKNTGFWEKSKTTPGVSITNKLRMAQKTGTLNLTGMSLSALPSELNNFQELQLIDNWWEAYPLLKIDCSNNLLESVPADLAIHADLNTLILKGNKLKSIDGAIFTLKLLKLIDVSHNELSLLPEMMGECASLVELMAHTNKIQALPLSIGNLSKLEILDLSGNSLTALPPTLGKLGILKKLNLSSNKLAEVPDSIGLLSKLEELNLSNNVISTVHPMSLSMLGSLVLLDMTRNKLTTLSAIPKSAKLARLLLTFNKLRDLEELENAPNLTVLDVDNNSLEKVPQSVVKLQKLKTLNIANNSINSIPPELALLESLTKINIEGNPLKSIKGSLRTGSTEALKKHLKMKLSEDVEDVKYQEELKAKSEKTGSGSALWDTLLREFYVGGKLDLKDKKLTEVHDIVWTLNKMQELDISSNPIKEISPKISQLSDLKIFKANKCKIEQITHGIANNSRLHLLELKGNLLKNFLPKIPRSEVLLHSLTTLDLSNNKLTAIPSALKHLPKLSTLLLAYNQITEIGKLCRKEFENLYVLDVSNNKIAVIPNAFAFYVKSIQNLNLSNNDLIKIPPNLGFLPNLKTIQVDGNPLKSVRRPVVEKGSVAIIEYLKQKYNESVDSQIETFPLDSDEEKEEVKKMPIKPILVKPHPEPMEDIRPVEAKVDNTARIEELTKEIDKLSKEIEENYAMPKPKLMEKKRHLVKLNAERARLLH